MSTWVVTHAHIDAMVQQLGVEKLIEPADADKVGRKLWRENVEAFRYCYSGRHPEDIPKGWTKYVFAGSEAPLDEVAVHMLIRCFMYQCSEEDGYDEKPGFKLVGELRRIIAARHGFVYDAADAERNDDHKLSESLGIRMWGISSIEEATVDAVGREAVS